MSKFCRVYLLLIWFQELAIQSTGAFEYVDCISADWYDPLPNKYLVYDTN